MFRNKESKNTVLDEIFNKAIETGDMKTLKLLGKVSEDGFKRGFLQGCTMALGGIVFGTVVGHMVINR